MSRNKLKANLTTVYVVAWLGVVVTVHKVARCNELDPKKLVKKYF